MHSTHKRVPLRSTRAARGTYNRRVDLFEPIRGDPRLGEIVRRLRTGGPPVVAEGQWGASAPILAALAAEQSRRPLLLITAHPDEADDFLDDVEAALGVAPELFPQLESLDGPEGADNEIAGERLRVCMALANRRPTATQSDSQTPLVIVAPIFALMQSVPSPQAIHAASRELRVGQSLSPDELAEWLAEAGFTPVDAVEHVADFARRGGIIDIFSHAMAQAVRVEFFGDEIESIRQVEPGTQRSGGSLGSVLVPAMRLGNEATKQPGSSGDTTGFLAHLPADAVIAIHEPVEVQEIGRTLLRRVGERQGLVPVDAIFRRANDFATLHLQRFSAGVSDAIDFGVQSLPQFEAKAEEKLEGLRELASSASVLVFCDNAAERQRFTELLEQQQPTLTGVETAVGVIHRGFRWGHRAYVPHHEIFQRYRQRRTLRRVAPARAIDSFFDLKPGDYVVHVQHGIARFRGLQSLDKGPGQQEYLVLEFAERATVHVPVSQIHLVQKYIGSVRGRATLSTLGGTAWKKTKERVAESVTDLAAELLAIQAQRATQPGIAYPHDTLWQTEFEESFLYQETEDQLRALSEIKTDMARPRPMDRLLCGDVGFGKTELAIRAAFKAMEFGKQVAVLVPTTVLAEQHFQTFSERLADYPFRIASLSRFRSGKQQKQIIEKAKTNQVDIVIGTHRLLSKDVKFADLGLVIIDEEQRFGVTAKEKLKQMRATVDVLTLSATPIPRTLHMALLGIRDISSLQTPPVDRRAIVTQVRTWDAGLIRDAIVRELNREGQVYFVHNRVRDIHLIEARLREIVPEARIVSGHGQMEGHELEAVMLKFMNREADILVATTIIESGIDIPTANTMFINRADRYGLADLHQLRGRVGRSKHRAYCYLLLSPNTTVTDKAAKRLKAIEHYSELGAGFQIAMRDLEIRGAGNILGPEQSGNIEAVGYELYCQLLEQACRRLKNEEIEPYRPVNLDLKISGSVPRGYIRSDRQRMEVYKRLTVCQTLGDVSALREELRDAFGPVPPETETLLSLAEIRVLARPWGIRSLILDGPDVIFAIDDLQKVQPLFATGPGSPRIPDPKTVHWRLPQRLLAPERLVEALRTQLQGPADQASGPDLIARRTRAAS